MTLRVAGIMSGTSYDAIDIAVAGFDRDGDVLRCGPCGMISRAIDSDIRSRIAAVLPPNPTTIAEVCRLDNDLGRLFAATAAAALADLGDVDLVVSHGQTVFHWIEDRTALGTLQLGSPAWIAEATGAAVLSDVRSRDLARGGQGAPLASTLDDLLVLSGDIRRGALNLGGIANITVRDPDLIGYDIGPAGALLDLVVATSTHGAERMDTDGARAARGAVDTSLLDDLLDEPYYRLDPPKSTGKELFHADYLAAKIGNRDLDLDDLVATLTELTARLIADACRRHRLQELVIAGGGVRNPTLVARISELAGTVRVRPFDDFGLPAQAKEAYLMALIGYLTWNGLPGTIASATGASSRLGSLTPGTRALQLPPPATGPVTQLIIDPVDQRPKISRSAPS